MVEYIKKVGIALSILINVILGGPLNQTFSARNWGWKRENKPNLVWFIDWIAKNVFNDIEHCRVSWCYWIILKNNLNRSK